MTITANVTGIAHINLLCFFETIGCGLVSDSIEQLKLELGVLFFCCWISNCCASLPCRHLCYKDKVFLNNSNNSSKYSKASSRRCFIKKVFLKISQNWQEKICFKASGKDTYLWNLWSFLKNLFWQYYEIVFCNGWANKTLKLCKEQGILRHASH